MFNPLMNFSVNRKGIQVALLTVFAQLNKDCVGSISK